MRQLPRTSCNEKKGRLPEDGARASCKNQRHGNTQSPCLKPLAASARAPLHTAPVPSPRSAGKVQRGPWVFFFCLAPQLFRNLGFVIWISFARVPSSRKAHTYINTRINKTPQNASSERVQSRAYIFSDCFLSGPPTTARGSALPTQAVAGSRLVRGWNSHSIFYL